MPTLSPIRKTDADILTDLQALSPLVTGFSFGGDIPKVELSGELVGGSYDDVVAYFLEEKYNTWRTV